MIPFQLTTCAVVSLINCLNIGVPWLKKCLLQVGSRLEELVLARVQLDETVAKALVAASEGGQLSLRRLSMGPCASDIDLPLGNALERAPQLLELALLACPQ